MSNTIVYQEEWETKVQERLSEPVKWKDICTVVYTNERVIHNPYLTDPTAATHTRGTAYSVQDITLTDDSVTVNASRIIPQFIDYADLAQTQYATQMSLADRQAVVMLEAIESYIYGLHAAFTNIGDNGSGAVTLSQTTGLTVSATNIDDIIRGVRREVIKAKGETMLQRYGGFIVWRPQDYELLEAFMQANGYSTADKALQSGIPGTQYGGIDYMGFTHFSSNLLASGHVFAGVKKQMYLYILKDTWGRVYTVDHPAAAGGGNLSGINVETRADFVGKVWNNLAPVLFDVNVA